MVDADARASSMDRMEERINALEAAFAVERQQRDQIEKKYARLKRRYVRLERAHAQMLEQTQGMANSVSGVLASPAPSAASSSSTSATHRSSNSFARESPSGVIDLTSPTGSRRTSAAASPFGSASSMGMQNSQLPLSSEDFCAESPATPVDGGISATPLRRSSRRVAATTRVETPSPIEPLRVGSTRRRQLDFRPDPAARPRPRLGLTSEETDSPSFRWRSRRLSASASPVPEFSPDRDDRSYARSPTQSSPSVSVDSVSVAAASSNSGDSDEAASIALAQYLQQQENQAAMQEYEERIRAAMAEYSDQSTEDAHRQLLLQGSIDPDNMTYDELLQLGEQVGDVKKERWREMAVQVLSSLPTHRWASHTGDDISCIVCQYEFTPGDVALTLPCTHIFHEECVSGWVRENNSCPLCKLEIAQV